MKNADVWQISFCATVGLCIESNVVGYQTKAVGKNLSQQVCTFDQIGVTGGALDIQKLLPTDGEGDVVGNGAVNVQFLSDRGVLQSSYAYYDTDEYDDGMPAGWYDENEDELAVYSFDSAEGFMVYSTSTAEFQYSGEVNMAETDVPFRKNLSPQGNIRPTTVDIQTIIPVDGEENVIGNGAVNVQFLSDRGVLLASYAYYDDDEYDDGMTAGWYDENEDELAVYSFAAGEGFMLYATQAGYLRFPEL